MSENRGDAGLTGLYTAAVLLGSALLFLVEPMSGKRLLPLLGAAPAVWNTCLLFFQAALLAGYAYAHGSAARLSLRAQAVVHGVLVLLPLPVLSLVAAPSPPPAGAAPVAWLLQALAVSVGLPFVLLSAGAPLLQSWFSRSTHPRAHDPWFLYAASNAGSLLGLLAYPLLLEPMHSLRTQGALWARAYVVYAALVLLCALRAWRSAGGLATTGVVSTAPAASRRGSAGAGAESSAKPRSLEVVRWIALAAVPSSLTLGVTTYLATDVASVPLLWVVPLSLYLLTFVVAFSRAALRATAIADRLLPMQALLVAMLTIGGFAVPLALAMLLHLLLFTVAALVCHGQLAAARPATSRLTAYYLAIAFGGALGSALNALVAPLVFRGIAEYPLAIVLACALRPPRPGGEGRAALSVPSLVAALAGALTLAVVLWANGVETDPRLHAALLAVPVLLAYAIASRPRRFAAAIGLMLLAGSFSASHYGTVVHAERTFFGVHRVIEDPATERRVLMHGTTLHGMQDLAPAQHHEPLGYYDRTGPFGQAFDALPAASGEKVGVVGLGAGVLASYARPGQRWTFYEIDPAVVRIARDQRFFGFLSECAERCTVVEGDARMSLVRAPESTYDLLVLDAFSSDAIPVHLLTSEAFSLYLSRLSARGAILLHFSNRHLALLPVLGRLAQAHRLVAVAEADPARPGSPAGKLPSEWMILVRDARDLGPLIVDPRWVAVPAPKEAPLWTDDFSNVVSVLRWRSPSRR